MTTGLRVLATITVALGTFVVALVALGLMGLDRVPYAEIPIAVFITALAVWPMISTSPGLVQRQAFADWLAYNTAFSIVFGLVMWSASTWGTANRILEDYPK